LRDGSFEVAPCGSEATRIVLTTRYQRHLAPRWLWEPIERRVVHTLHGHVLEGMKRRAEQTPDPSQSDEYEPDPFRAVPLGG
jgi:hypothetical protein